MKAAAHQAPLKVLAIDDERLVLEVFSRQLARRGLVVEGFTEVGEALEVLRHHSEDFAVVLLDLNMPERQGRDVLPEIRSIDPTLPVIVVTAENHARTAVDLIHAGALDYLVKPIREEKLSLAVAKAFRFGELERQTLRLERKLNATTRLVGSSRQIREVTQMIERVAGSDACVLILGESGTGKELVARQIVEASPRANQPFVPLNCGALSGDVLDSELFGHEQGAFTGAIRKRQGAFVEANHGTLLLDEIGDIPPAAQLRLLRVLQEGEIRAVGATGSRPVDVRVLGATNVDLKAAVDAGTFRADLYYRLNVITIHVPPLRERREDIPELVAHFVARHTPSGLARPSIHPETLEWLCRYDWPGNIRELENAVQHALALCGQRAIQPRHLPEAIQPHRLEASAHDARGGDELLWTDECTFLEARQQVRERFEFAYFRRLLERTENNVSEAARRAGLDRSNLRRILRRLDFDR